MVLKHVDYCLMTFLVQQSTPSIEKLYNYVFTDILHTQIYCHELNFQEQRFQVSEFCLPTFVMKVSLTLHIRTYL